MPAMADARYPLIDFAHFMIVTAQIVPLNKPVMSFEQKRLRCEGYQGKTLLAHLCRRDVVKFKSTVWVEIQQSLHLKRRVVIFAINFLNGTGWTMLLVPVNVLSQLFCASNVYLHHRI